MLILLGYLMVVTFMVLIMTRRLSALVALILVPLVFGLLAGHRTDLGPMAIDGITKLAPTAALLLAGLLAGLDDLLPPVQEITITGTQIVVIDQVRRRKWGRGERWRGSRRYFPIHRF